MTTFAKHTAPTLADRINYANGELQRARQDGQCAQIMYWIMRRDYLLEQWPRPSLQATGESA
jgi:hypothetical protein